MQQRFLHYFQYFRNDAADWLSSCFKASIPLIQQETGVLDLSPLAETSSDNFVEPKGISLLEKLMRQKTERRFIAHSLQKEGI